MHLPHLARPPPTIRSLKKGTGASKFAGAAANVIALNKKKKGFGNVDKRKTKGPGGLGAAGRGTSAGTGTSNPLMAVGGDAKEPVKDMKIGDEQL